VHPLADGWVPEVKLVSVLLFNALAVTLEEGFRGELVGHDAADSHDFGFDPEAGD
jgi:hypothetical protein